MGEDWEEAAARTARWDEVIRAAVATAAVKIVPFLSEQEIDVAAAAVYLASAGYVTGQVLQVNGGALLGHG
jgi:NAD(P)-dependent dehydrogenase (short-subunit alcohol dehydrogenase family)